MGKKEKLSQQVKKDGEVWEVCVKKKSRDKKSEVSSHKFLWSESWSTVGLTARSSADLKPTASFHSGLPVPLRRRPRRPLRLYFCSVTLSLAAINHSDAAGEMNMT